MPSRRDNRETLRRLFQGYVDDFGAVAGKKIIRAIVDEIGGMRITVPSNHNHKGENLDMIWRLYCRIRDEFGEASAKTIMQRFIMELKGIRLSFPDMQDLWRKERNERIHAEFRGNCEEQAIKWNLTTAAVRKIVRDGN